MSEEQKTIKRPEELKNHQTKLAEMKNTILKVEIQRTGLLAD